MLGSFALSITGVILFIVSFWVEPGMNFMERAMLLPVAMLEAIMGLCLIKKGD
jgi:hypothetical protein